MVYNKNIQEIFLSPDYLLHIIYLSIRMNDYFYGSFYSYYDSSFKFPYFHIFPQLLDDAIQRVLLLPFVNQRP